jgi:hypothetical protein
MKKKSSLVLMPIRRVPDTRQMPPEISSILGPFISNTGPTWRLQKKERKTYRLKTQPMELSLYAFS